MMRVYFAVSTLVLALASFSVSAAFPSKQRDNGVAIPLVKHSSFLNTDNSVNFDVLSSHIESVFAKISRGLHSHENNNRDRQPSGVTRKRDGTGIPLAYHAYGIGWYASITVGTPPKPFSVVPDTGSADLVLPAAACDASCEGHTRWDPAKTRPYPLWKPCQVDYTMGSVYGELYTDNVTVAGFTAKTQTLCAATQYPPRLHTDNFPGDGFMGMGFPSLSAYGADSVFQTLVKENSITNKVFSVYLNSKGGELYIGGANRDRYKGNFVDVSVNTEKGFWQVTVQNMQAKGKPVPGLDDVIAIIDTGSSLVVGDKPRVQKLHEALGGVHDQEGHYTYPCKAFPAVSFTFNGKSFPISASTHNIGPIWPDEPNPTFCWSGIIGRDFETSGVDFWVLGNVFLQNVYTSFDYDNKAIGFAQACSKKPGSNTCTIL